MADLATLQTWLTEAESAYHRILTGSQEEQVEHGDMRLTYTRANAGQLLQYIGSLRSQIVQLGGSASGLRRRPLTVNL